MNNETIPPRNPAIEQLRHATGAGVVSPFALEKIETIGEELSRVQDAATQAEHPISHEWRHVRWLLALAADQATEIARLKRNA